MGDPVSIGDMVSELRRGVEGGDVDASMIAVCMYMCSGVRMLCPDK